MPLSPAARNGLLVMLLLIAGSIGGIFYQMDYLKSWPPWEQEGGPVSTSTTVVATLVINFTTDDDYANGTGADEDGWLVFENLVTNQSTVYGLLMAANLSVASHPTSLGVFIDSIGGVANNQDDNNRWWIYSVNNADGGVAANNKVIYDGDLVKWEYRLYE